MKVSRRITARLAVPTLALMAACNQETRMTVSVQNMTMMADTEIATLWISTTPGERGDPFRVTPDGGMRRQFPIQIGVFLSSTVSYLTVVVEATNADGKTLGKGQTDVTLGPQVVFPLFLCRDGVCPMDGCPVADAEGHLPDGGAVEAGAPLGDCSAFCARVMEEGCPPDLFSTSLGSCEAACTIAIRHRDVNLTDRLAVLNTGADLASRCVAAGLKAGLGDEVACNTYCDLGAVVCPGLFPVVNSCNDSNVCNETKLLCPGTQLAQAILNRTYCARAAPHSTCACQ